MRNYDNGFLIWDDDLERELFTEEEIKANNKRVAKILERIKRRESAEMDTRKYTRGADLFEINERENLDEGGAREE